MRLCRFDQDRLGWVEDGAIRDVTPVLGRLPALRWPLPDSDPLWGSLGALRASLEAEAGNAARIPAAEPRLRSPVARPGKILAVRRNRGAAAGPQPDVFLKAPSAVAGPGDGIRVPALGRRVECELELALVIGRIAASVTAGEALSAVAGCCLALDLAVAGDEDRGLRKSADTFCVLGPWVSELGDLPDLGELELVLAVNGEPRQRGSVGGQPFSPARVVSHLSSFVTLHPGDVVLAGCPAPAVEVAPGDLLEASGGSLGAMTVRVRGSGGR